MSDDIPLWLLPTRESITQFRVVQRREHLMDRFSHSEIKMEQTEAQRKSRRDRYWKHVERERATARERSARKR